MSNLISFLLFFSLGTSIIKADFSIAVICFIFFILWNRYKGTFVPFEHVDKHIYLAMGIFGSLVMLSCLAHMDIKVIKNGFEYVEWMLPFFILVWLNKYGDVHKGIKLAMIVSIFIMCGYGIYQHYGLCIGRVKSFFAHPNHFATILELLLPFMLMYLKLSKSQIANICISVAIILDVWCIWLTGCRGTWLSLAVGALICWMMFLYYESPKNRIKVISLVLIGMLCLGGIWFSGKLNRSYDYQRVHIFNSSIEMWKDHKLVGVGIGNFGKLYQNKYINPEATEKHIYKSHNIVTAFLAYTGIVGTIGFIALNVILFLYLVAQLKLNIYNIPVWAMLWVLLTINIHGMVDTTFIHSSNNRMFWALLGIAYVYNNHKIRKE